MVKTRKAENRAITTGFETLLERLFFVDWLQAQPGRSRHQQTR
jgi:GrpB-like predicted nucleotidyltransferase (UPF0157 family)